MRFRRTPKDDSADSDQQEGTSTGAPAERPESADKPAENAAPAAPDQGTTPDTPGKESRALRRARRKEARIEKKIAKQEAKREREAARALIDAERKAAREAEARQKESPRSEAGAAPIHPDPSRPVTPGAGPSAAEVLAATDADGQDGAEEKPKRRFGFKRRGKGSDAESIPGGAAAGAGAAAAAVGAAGASEAGAGAIAATGQKPADASRPTDSPTTVMAPSGSETDASGGTSADDSGAPRSKRRSVLTGAALLAIGAGAALGITELTGEDEPDPTAPAPTVIVRDSSDADAADELGFPAFATKNTTRIGGADPTAVAAAAALAAFPSQGGLDGPSAVSLVEADNWQAAVTASVFASADFGAPMLIGDAGSVPEFTRTALEALDPRGARSTKGAQLIATGEVRTPEGLETRKITGETPAALAAEVDAQRAKLAKSKDNPEGAPDHVVLVNGEMPEFAAPAAAWAAFSGDPVLFVQENIVPPKTLEALRRYKKLDAYLLGPESAASEKVLRKLRTETSSVTRIAAETPVENAIEFARFSDADFGWGVIDPGHGFVIASVDQPIAAAAASILSRVGSPGPLLLTDKVDRLPGSLDGFLLSTKPGFIDDPSRAQFNSAWIIGDEEAIGIDQQAQIDERIDLAQISTGSGGPRLGGAPEAEPDPTR